ncbi:MAG TPA: sigma-70 family RNA polymerase sigma factor [Sedimentisphaerales bacterium]|nr:sigma-70 family RNA polymerase sigma factor [Sedimentisphaerales bacterium]
MNDRQAELLRLLDASGACLYALLTRLTLRQDVAEELMQDLFLKLHDAKDQGGIECWYAYARRTAINLAFNWRRRQAVRKTASLDALAERASDDTTPVNQLIQSEEIEQVLAGIDRLHGASREVLVLRYIQQESYEEIARQLGKTVHQARALCFKAMSALRDALGCGPVPADEKEVQHVEDE